MRTAATIHQANQAARDRAVQRTLQTAELADVLSGERQRRQTEAQKELIQTRYGEMERQQAERLDRMDKRLNRQLESMERRTAMTQQGQMTRATLSRLSKDYSSAVSTFNDKMEEVSKLEDAPDSLKLDALNNFYVLRERAEQLNAAGIPASLPSPPVFEVTLDTWGTNETYTVGPAVAEYIFKARAQGLSDQQISEALTREGIIK